jgi:hypothetical protein
MTVCSLRWSAEDIIRSALVSKTIRHHFHPCEKKTGDDRIRYKFGSALCARTRVVEASFDLTVWRATENVRRMRSRYVKGPSPCFPETVHFLPRWLFVRSYSQHCIYTSFNYHLGTVSDRSSASYLLAACILSAESSVLRNARRPLTNQNPTATTSMTAKTAIACQDSQHSAV